MIVSSFQVTHVNNYDHPGSKISRIIETDTCTAGIISLILTQQKAYPLLTCNKLAKNGFTMFTCWNRPNTELYRSILSNAYKYVR